ncbi:MAG: hypothetical protein H0W15_06940 [Gemmatimonadales bacterium]|nr:hypothetical protein [Gemmatimonadales bacterium]
MPSFRQEPICALFAAVIGVRAGFRVGRLIAITAGVDDYLYTAKFDTNDTLTSEEKQHDIRFTFGVRLPFLGF